jgi:hypothetical protein
MAKRHMRRAPVYEYQPYPITAAVGTATPVGRQVNTTASTAITAGTSVAVTPASMANIVIGMGLSIYGGTGTAEQVTVTAVSTTTFTATFVNAHSGTYNITSIKGTFLKGITINQVGTTPSIVLYNGNPAATPAGVAFATIVPTTPVTLEYDLAVDNGLWITSAATGTPNYTIRYIDEY